MTRHTILLVVVLIVLLGAFFALLQLDPTAKDRQETAGPKAESAAPADLARYRLEFRSGLEALQRQENADAARHLSSFSLSPRPVEQYRLYFLANAYQGDGQARRARQTLARLWRRRPTFVYMYEVGFKLGSHYSSAGSWQRAADVYATLAAREHQPSTLALARGRLVMEQFHAGDPAAMLFAARNTFIDSPQSEQAAAAADLIGAMLGSPGSPTVPMSLPERIRRAENLVRDGNPAGALAELHQLDAATLRYPFSSQVLLTRGLAHHRLRQFAESDRILQPLFAGYFKFAEPALLHSARNNRLIAASIDPFILKTVTEKRRVGTRKVRVKGRMVSRPLYRTVKKTVKLVDLNRKKKKEEHERRHVERLKDLLQIQISAATRKEALSTLLQLAQAKKQTAYMQQLASQLEELDPLSEPALQYFWDHGWAAYQRGDRAAARDMFVYIASTYSNPSIQRQASYWLARVHEQTGDRQRAAQLFQELVDVPYEDLYALHAKRRGAKPRMAGSPDPLSRLTRDWEEIVEDRLPPELRLSYELTALGVNREARLEIQKNANEGNRRYADAILGDLFHAEGSTILAHRYVRRAFPKIATVEQDEVPPHFLRIYYPLKYEAEIRQAAANRKLDPYLVMALVHQESAFNAEIRSRAGAVGLMQLMPSTGRELGNRLYAAFTEARLENPEVNLELGTYYLRHLLDQSGGSVELALTAYNAGPGNLRRWRRARRRVPLDEFIESIPYSETRGYVKRITILRSSYQRLTAVGAERRAPIPALQ